MPFWLFPRAAFLDCARVRHSRALPAELLERPGDTRDTSEWDAGLAQAHAVWVVKLQVWLELGAGWRLRRLPEGEWPPIRSLPGGEVSGLNAGAGSVSQTSGIFCCWFLFVLNKLEGTALLRSTKRRCPFSHGHWESGGSATVKCRKLPGGWVHLQD